VVKAAHEELDRVCGDRLPELDDTDNLPYIRGCIKESFRWMPTTLLGMPHACIRDDEYMGYRIPKGAGVMYNVWCVFRLFICSLVRSFVRSLPFATSRDRRLSWISIMLFTNLKGNP
jgi:hypothetical protein